MTELDHNGYEIEYCMKTNNSNLKGFPFDNELKCREKRLSD